MANKLSVISTELANNAAFAEAIQTEQNYFRNVFRVKPIDTMTLMMTNATLVINVGPSQIMMTESD